MDFWNTKRRDNPHGLGASGADLRGFGGVVVSEIRSGVERGPGCIAGRITRNRSGLNRVSG